MVSDIRISFVEVLKETKPKLLSPVNLKQRLDGLKNAGNYDLA
jgi:hypothetical protein